FAFGAILRSAAVATWLASSCAEAATANAASNVNSRNRDIGNLEMGTPACGAMGDRPDTGAECCNCRMRHVNEKAAGRGDCAGRLPQPVIFLCSSFRQNETSTLGDDASC